MNSLVDSARRIDLARVFQACVAILAIFILGYFLGKGDGIEVGKDQGFEDGVASVEAELAQRYELVHRIIMEEWDTKKVNEKERFLRFAGYDGPKLNSEEQMNEAFKSLLRLQKGNPGALQVLFDNLSPDSEFSVIDIFALESSS